MDLAAVIAVLIGGAALVWVARISARDQALQQFLQRKQGYALADVSTRLSVFQEASFQWERAFGVVWADDPEKSKVLAEVSEWLSGNQIYLGEKLSRQFHQVLLAIELHAGFVEASREIWRQGGDATESRQKVRENWAEIMDLREALFSATSLPTLGGAQETDPLVVH